MNVSLKTMAENLCKIQAAQIYFHKKPDGDAIGASHALALGLETLNIPCELLCCDPIPAIYRPVISCVHSVKAEGAIGIAVDSSTPGRLGKYADVPVMFCIDHHENNQFDAEYQYVDDTASSCSQIIYWLLREMKVPVTPQIANLLYTGLVTDTISFRSVSTNTASLQAAWELASCGADVAAIARRHCLKKSRERMEIEQVLTSTFRYECSGHVLGCYFSHADMVRIGTNDSDLEGLNTIAEQVDGVEIGIVVRETVPLHCRVSVRTGEGFRADKICALFGGGGHANAAGCSLEGKPEEVLMQVEKASAEHYAAGKGSEA